MREIKVNLDINQEYERKLISPEAAAGLVKSGDWIDYGLCCGQPIAVDRALAKRADELRDVKVRACISMRMPEIMKVHNALEHFSWHSLHMSSIDRQISDAGQACYIPIRLFETARYYRENFEPIDVTIFQVAPMDEHGYFSLGPQISWLMGTIEKSRVIIFEVNRNMPRTLGGYDDKLHISQIDYVVEGPHEPLPTVRPEPPGDIDQRVAKHIIEEIPDGACLQLGIGGMPGAVGSMLAHTDLKDLGVHTELYSDSLMQLAKSGKINGKKKNLDRGLQVYCFAFGSEELYRYLDNNPELAAYPGDYTNDPNVMGRIDNFISINNAIEVDLYGQISSESFGCRHISGNGGAVDFALGAYLSRGGKSFVCLSSSYERNGVARSRIVPILRPGSVVTSSRTLTHYVVTEYGKANLKGKSTWERAEALIELADPKFRDPLITYAGKMKIWRRSNKQF